MSRENTSDQGDSSDWGSIQISDHASCVLSLPHPSRMRNWTKGKSQTGGKLRS